MQKTKQDFIAGLLVLSISFFYMIYTLILDRAAIGNPHAPKIFPLILSGIGIILSLFLLVRSVCESDHTYNQQHTGEQKPAAETKQLLPLALVVSAIGAGYAILFEFLGYPLSTALFLMAYMFFLNGKKRWRINIVVPIVFSVSVYIVFAILLSVPLPLWPGFL